MLTGDGLALPQGPGPATPAPSGDTSTAGAATAGAGSAGTAPNNAWQPAPGGPPAPPAVSLPKGGGAIRDIGEKFSVNAATGTASLTVPVPVSPGRAGFGPSLELAYDSGAGNSPFGLGWSAAMPAITRKTDKGLPRYRDDPDEDTFILSGAEDLVPWREERDGGWEQVAGHRTWRGQRFLVQRYRPRVEGLFSRIERWRDVESGETHWRTITSGNVTSRYGTTPQSRVADPADPGRVFSWLICESYDDTGNEAVYEYSAEDSAGVDGRLACERNRTEQSRSAGRYCKRIRYGNRVPRREASEDHPDWMFEVVFDYGDHDERDPRPAPDHAWPSRPDPFSTYRPGFEVRTYRRCHRVLMFHHFPSEPGVGADCLVSSTDLTYASTGGSGMSTIASVTHTGYRRRPDGGYHRESLPPLEFHYSRAVVGDEPHDLAPDALRHLPAGIDGTTYQWLDLDGEGISGVLTRQGGAWSYKANLGDGRFAAERVLAAQPAGGGAGERLLDLAGDGHLDLTELSGPAPGFYERTFDREWRPFRPFRSQPDIAWDDLDLRMVDLDGDGLADVLITCDDAFSWHPSFGYEGFGAARRTCPPWDEEKGPRVVFADPEQAIYLADMSGDGLADLVRVRVGEVCYWPNTGYGTFGGKVAMDGIPWLDEPDHFDQRRVRLADVDGSGTADLVYLHRDGARLYLNRSGNSFSEPEVLPQGFPRVDSVSDVMVADLLGRGTACLVWSSPLPADSGRQVSYLDLMTAGKPYLLTGIVNNLGGETWASYASSTQFYLADAAAGRPWVTRLPFPVQVVERVDTLDRVNRTRFTTRHAYHHGYFDGFEREFRGFGMVETWDTEQLAVLEGDEFTNLDPATDLPPVLTRTWLHTGVFPGEDRVTRLYAHEYYRQPGGGDPSLPSTPLPSTLRQPGQAPRRWRLSRDETREACRALKGMPLREEVYALDGSEAQQRPYLVTEHNYTIELLQPGTEPRPDGPQNYHAVFLAHGRETVTAHYERALYHVDGARRADPRITHDVVLAVDDYGNTLRSASAGYGRRYPDPDLAPADQAAQARLRLTCAEDDYTNAVEEPDAHRTPAPASAKVFEVIGLAPAGRLFGFTELRDGLARVTAEVPFEDWDAGAGDRPAPTRRLIAHSEVRYRRDDLSGALPVGVLEPLALPYRSYRLAFTDDLLTSLYGNDIDAGMLREAGYLREGGAWRLPSGRVHYSPGAPAGDGNGAAAELDYARRHFFLPQRFTDPFGNTTSVRYDRYDLLVVETRDPLGNRVSAGDRNAEDHLTSLALDYRVLAPQLVSDANRNRVAVSFDTLGRVCGTAVMGKPEERLGDSLDGFQPDLPVPVVTAYFADPFGHSHEILGQATTRVLYDTGAYWRSHGEQPSSVAVLARETHVSDLGPGQQTRIQRRFSYSDGFGREVQHKSQAAAGPVKDGGGTVERRWTGSGWTVFNNKGQPVRTYEPFFTALPGFEFARAEGVSPVLFYDAAGRVAATLNPDGSYTKTTFDSWHAAAWDAADTVLLDPREDPDVRGYMQRYLAVLGGQPGGWLTWHERRAGGDLGRAAQRAAAQTAAHAGTPSRAWLDSLGRTFLTVAHNRVRHGDGLAEEYCRTHSALDIQGNEHKVRDAHGRVVMRYRFALLGSSVAHAGMDSGGGHALPDVSGKPVFTRDSRGFAVRTDYDPLRRPVRTYVSGPGIDGRALTERTEYGESVPDPAARNLRTRVVRQHDGAGIVATPSYDFKGNPLAAGRTFAAEYATSVLDWDADVPLEQRDYLTHARYDALNRPALMTSPDRTVLAPAYDPASQLDRLAGHLRGGATSTVFAAHIEYNARGQRTLVEHGNGTATDYSYDPLTFRLAHLVTRRGQRRLQDLRYTYDAVGNPTQLSDHAQQRVFFRNRVVRPAARYTYDALYQLIEATGREHLGQAGVGQAGPVPPSATDAPRTGLPQPGDGSAMARYTERYSYDEVGNLLRVAHRSADPAYGGWTCVYRYEEPSLLEPGRRGNRLSGAGPERAVSAPQPFSYDEQGNTTVLPGVGALRWDYADRLHAAARRLGSDGETGLPETTYYTYDATGQRVRKTTVRTGREVSGARKAERFYVGGFEVFREYEPDGEVRLERETLHIFDDRHRVALVETRTAGTDDGPAELTRYQYSDHLDSAVLELDQRGQVISYEEFYPFGATSYQAVRALTEAPKRYRHNGKERDTETGCYYYGARYYAPWLGRWTSCDPAGLADGVNVYAYVHNNPIALHDPAGYNTKTAPFGMISNDPRIAGLWEKAVQEQLGKKLGGKTAKETLALFRKEVLRLEKTVGLGSNRQKGTAINFARESFKGVRARFARMLKAEGISLKGTQIHHMMEELATHPQSALDVTNLMYARGQAKVLGSGHHFAHQVGDAHAAGVKNPGVEEAKKLRAQGIEPDVPELHAQGAAKQEASAVVKNETKVVAKDAGGETLKVTGKETADEALKITGKEALETEGKTGLKEGAKLLGTKAAKFVPFVGIGVGIGLVGLDLKKGDYASAAWDTAEAIPVVGDVVGAGHLGIATGTLMNEGLGIDKVAAEHGMAAEHAAKWLGLGSDGATIVGATTAALSSITVAPTIALDRKIASWL